jgi:hypothetical protein
MTSPPESAAPFLVECFRAFVRLLLDVIPASDLANVLTDEEIGRQKALKRATDAAKFGTPETD